MGGSAPDSRDMDFSDDGIKDDPFASKPSSKTAGQEGYGVGVNEMSPADIKDAESARAWTTEGMAAAAAVGASAKIGNEYPITHPILSDLIRAGKTKALANLGYYLAHPQPLAEDQRLTPIHGGGSHLRIPLENQPIEIDLHTIDRSGRTPKVGALVAESVEVREGHSIPAGAWFSGMELEDGKVNIPPSFAARSTKAQEAYKIPPVIDLLKDQVITPEDAVLLLKSATGEFSQWLAGANEHRAVKHPRFQPLSVSTFTEADWHKMIRKAEAESRKGFVDTLEPWRTVIPENTGVPGAKIMIFNGRGFFIERSKLMEIDVDATNGRRGFDSRDEKKALGMLPKLGMIQDGYGSGISTGYEYAAWACKTPGALFIPTERTQVLTIPIAPNDLYMAVQAMTAIQLKNLLMTVHTGMQAQELGIKEAPVWIQQARDLAGKTSTWFRRRFAS